MSATDSDENRKKKEAGFLLKKELLLQFFLISKKIFCFICFLFDFNPYHPDIKLFCDFRCGPWFWCNLNSFNTIFPGILF